MEQILSELRNVEQKYLENLKETLNFIKRFKKLCNYGEPVAQVPEELSGNYKLLEQTFKNYQDIYEFNKKLLNMLYEKSQIDPFNLAVFFQQNSSEFTKSYSLYSYCHLKHTVSLVDNNVTYFNNLSRQVGISLNLGQELQRPQKMISRYLKMFSELSELAKENDDEELDMMLIESREIISSIDFIIDDLSKADSIEGYSGNIRKEGFLLKSGGVRFILDTKKIYQRKVRKSSFSTLVGLSSFEGPVLGQSPSRLGTEKVKEDGYMFLFEGSLMLCRKRKNVYESVKFFSNFNLAVRILRDTKFELENVETNEKIWIFLEDNKEMLSWVQKISKFLQKYNILLKTFCTDHLAVPT